MAENKKNTVSLVWELAEPLARCRTGGIPGPVQALHDLVPCLIVAGQTGLGDFRAGFERAFQGFELAVIDGSGKRQRHMHEADEQSGTKSFPCCFHAFLPVSADDDQNLLQRLRCVQTI